MTHQEILPELVKIEMGWLVPSFQARPFFPPLGVTGVSTGRSVVVVLVEVVTSSTAAGVEVGVVEEVTAFAWHEARLPAARFLPFRFILWTFGTAP